MSSKVPSVSVSPQASKYREIVDALLTTDPERLGRRFLLGVATAAMLTVTFAVALRSRAIAPDLTLGEEPAYRTLLSLHALIGVFMVALPLIPGVLGHLLIPRLLPDAKPAWPELHRLAWGLWVLALTLFTVAMSLDAADTDWSLSPPYSVIATGSVAWTAFAVATASVAVACLGLSMLAWIVREGRSRGFDAIPVFGWALSAGALLQVFVGVAVATLMGLLLSDRWGGTDWFNSARGGDPFLYRQLFALCFLPAIVSVLVPALGLLSQLLCDQSSTPTYARRTLIVSFFAAVGLALPASGALHLAGGSAPSDQVAGSVLALAFALPGAAILLSWLGSVAKPSQIDPGILYIISAMVSFAVGGAAALLLIVLPAAAHFQGTIFGPAVLHLTIVGGGVGAALAGLHDPRLNHSGRAFGRWAWMSGGLFFVGAFLCFVPWFVLGAMGQTAGSSVYQEEFQALQVLSSVGGLTLVTGLIGSACSVWQRLTPPLETTDG